MPTIYEHQRPKRRIINFTYARTKEIDKQIEQLQLERDLMQEILDKYEPLVCQDCLGEGSIMKPIEGCECDGPRLHQCETCKGTGELVND